MVSNLPAEKGLRRVTCCLLLGLLCAGVLGAYEFVYGLAMGGPARDAPIISGGYRADSVTGVALDRRGNVYVAGVTYSPAFPATGTDNTPRLFVARLNPAATAYVWVRVLEGQRANAIAVDAAGNVVVAGTGGVYAPSGVQALQVGPLGEGDTFVAKWDSSGTLLFTAAIGGSKSDTANTLALDAAGNIYVAGETLSPDFPVSNGAFQTSYRTADPHCGTAFAAKISAAGTGMTYATFLGGTACDAAHAIAVDASGGAYLAGVANSADFPTTGGVLQPRMASSSPDSFIAKLNATGAALAFSTYLGGTWEDSANALALASDGSIYVAGTTASADFPTTAGAFQTARPRTGYSFVARLNATASALVYSTYFGAAAINALALDSSGNVHIAGETSGALPIARAVQPVYYGGRCYSYSPSSGMPTSSYTCPDAFAAALNATGSALLYSTYLSGAGKKAALAVAVDDFNGVYVGGRGALYLTESNQLSSGGSAFLVKLGGTRTPPYFTRESITNGASFSSGLSLPGGVASIFCTNLTGIPALVAASGAPLPMELGGVSVLIDGHPAPLYSVSDSGGVQQINIQVPFETIANINAVEVRRDGISASVLGVKNFTSAGGLFTVDGVNGAIQHGTDYSLVTAAAPAERGEVIILYATGLGAVAPAVASGEAAPDAPLSWVSERVTVTMGGYNAEVQFSGLAPGFVGLYQINARVPTNVPSGDAEVRVSLPPVSDPTVNPYPLPAHTVYRVSKPANMRVR